VRAWVAPLSTLALLAACLPARGQELVTDVSRHLVAITSSYSGTELLLFGGIDGGGDIVVVVRGPAEAITIRRKDRVFGVWANVEKAEFRSVPSFYAVASSRPLDEIAQPRALARLQIGAEHLRLGAVRDLPPERLAPFRAALLRLKTEADLFSAEAGQVSFLGNRLFRVEVKVPANVPIGTFTAEVYLFRDGNVVAAQTTPIFVDKLGFERAVYATAQRQPALYGLAAILVALLAGWLAAVAMRKT